MKTIYLVTGAGGHLGSAVCTLLAQRGECVRALLRTESNAYLQSLGVDIFVGDVTDPTSLEEFFTAANAELTVIHCAGIVDINCKYSAEMERVNIGGTANIIDAVKRHKVKRLVYVSSVHAIPPLTLGRVITEVQAFDPALVEGAYAKTKATAAQLVLESVKDGVPAVIVHPSGIIGPYLGKGNHLVQLVKNYLNKKLPACVKGGYDFVDVRDCAEGIFAAAAKGRVGECYILSGGFYQIKEMLDMLSQISGRKKIGTIPMWLARMAAPAMAKNAIRRQRKPLFTKYSLFTLGVNGRFSHDKATVELGYQPRELYVTLRDTVKWLTETGEYKQKIKLPAGIKRKIKAGV